MPSALCLFFLLITACPCFARTEVDARQSSRNLLYTAANCACVCAGTHEGYILGASSSGQCSSSACISSFPSCQPGQAEAFYSDGSTPRGTITGVMTQQSINPPQCNSYNMGGSCSKQYAFSVTNGFISLISTSSDTCVPGSALQSYNYQTKGTTANGHMSGSGNATAFTLTRASGGYQLNINQGCIVTYKITSGGELLPKSGGKCFPASASVQTPSGHKAMSDLQVGDKVLTALPSGKTLFETVFMFSHQSHTESSVFVCIESEAGHKLKLSPGHYIWSIGSLPSLDSLSHDTSAWSSLNQAVPHSVKPDPVTLSYESDTFDLSRAAHSAYDEARALSQTIYQSHREIQRAADIKNGDYVWVASPDKNELVLIKVKTVGLIQDSGLFNPHTGSGNIVVDGILALTFTESLPPQPGIHKIVTAPAALLYRLTPSLVWANKINSMLLAVFGVS